jgi:hypothetical protein
MPKKGDIIIRVRIIPKYNVEVVCDIFLRPIKKPRSSFRAQKMWMECGVGLYPISIFLILSLINSGYVLLIF